MSSLRPARSTLDRAFFALVIRAAIIFTVVVFILLPFLYFWSLEKAA